MSRPTILFMNRVYPPVYGATGRVLRDLAEGFAREGWHVTVVSSGKIAGETRKNGVRIIRVKAEERPRHIFVYLWIWIKMFIIAMRLKPRDVLVSMSDPPLLVVAGAFVARFKKSHHVNWCHDLYPEIMPSLGMKLPKFVMNIFISWRRRAMCRADQVIVNGRCMAKYLVSDGLDVRHISMIPNWPDRELVEDGYKDDAKRRDVIGDVDDIRPFDRLIKTDQKFRVLYAGNLGRAHPFETILGAAEILQKKKPDIEFVFVGGGFQYDDLVEMRAKRGLDNVRMLPFQPASALQEIMESGDVHLVTLHDDAAGFMVPSKLYTGLAVARPCILVGPRDSENAKVIEEFEAGFVVAQGDSESLAAAILTFREDGDAWFSAHRGALQAKDVFRPANSIRAWIDCVNNITHEETQSESFLDDGEE